MRVVRSRKITVNMGQYESLVFGCEVELTHGDMGLTDQEALKRCSSVEGRRELLATLDDEAIHSVHGFLAAEIKESSELTLEEKSFLLRAAARRVDRLDEDDEIEDRPRSKRSSAEVRARKPATTRTPPKRRKARA